VADTLSVLDDHLQLTVGARNQRIAAQQFDFLKSVQTANYDKERTSPSVGLVIKPVDHLSLYANYIEAFTQGPVAPAAGVANPSEVSSTDRFDQQGGWREI
jgi:iron complex outermembrane recepter protein